MSTTEPTMIATMLPYVAQAVGGAVGGNILGMLTRGGGGVVGRSLIGAVGGVALALVGAETNGLNVEVVRGVTDMWGPDKLGALLGDNTTYLSQAITGAVGGGVLGLVGGLLIRPRD